MAVNPEELHDYFTTVRERIREFESLYPQYRDWEIARHEIWVIEKIIEREEGRKGK